MSYVKKHIAGTSNHQNSGNKTKPRTCTSRPNRASPGFLSPAPGRPGLRWTSQACLLVLRCDGQGWPGLGAGVLALLRIPLGEAGSEGTGRVVPSGSRRGNPCPGLHSAPAWPAPRLRPGVHINSGSEGLGIVLGRRAAAEAKEFQTIRERHVDALCAAPRSPGHRPERPEPQKHGRQHAAKSLAKLPQCTSQAGDVVELLQASLQTSDN